MCAYRRSELQPDNKLKLKKFNASQVTVGNSFNIIARTDDDVLSQESKKELTKAQSEAQKLMQEALIKVEEIIAQAQSEAAEILEQAKQDAINIQASAQETGQQIGFETGYQTGYNQSVEQTVGIITSAETIINGAYQAQREILLNSEKEMLDLIITICRKVILKELKTQPDILLRMTEAAIKELKEREMVRLMVNPECVNLLTKASPLLVKRITGLQTIKIIEDRSVPPTGVIVESISGKIDGQVDTQLEEILTKLMDEAIANPAPIDLPDPKQMPTENIKQILDQ